MTLEQRDAYRTHIARAMAAAGGLDFDTLGKPHVVTADRRERSQGWWLKLADAVLTVPVPIATTEQLDRLRFRLMNTAHGCDDMAESNLRDLLHESEMTITTMAERCAQQPA